MTKAKCNSRQGQSLLIMVLLLIVLAGVLALTLDFGFVVLSRRTMQTVVNTAALEGARNIDDAGREDAQALMRNVVDDDLDPTANPSTLGLGPDQSLVGRDAQDRPLLGDGISAQDLSQKRPQYIYRPIPQLNLDNAPHGDFVIGDFDADATSHIETATYLRTDFAPNLNGSAFLARLRRTPDRGAIANPLDREASVSSSGSGSPLLMGHLAWFTAPNDTNAYDIRRDGISIRATAIANAQPVIHVGTSTRSEVYRSTSFGYVPAENEWYELDNAAFNLGEIRARIDQDLNTPNVDPVDFSVVPEGYAAVLADYSGDDYVIGFTLKSAAPDRLPNASPRLQDAWPTLSTLAPDIRAEVLRLHEEYVETDPDDLARAPSLVRSTP